MAQVVVPDVCVPGTSDWLAATVSNARHYATYAEQNVRPLVERCRELRQQEAWLPYFTDDPKTWERFCVEALGYEAAFLAELESGVAILEQRGHTGDISSKLATETYTLYQHGEIGNGRSRGNNITSTLEQRGTDRIYTRARLRRDRPDLAVRVDAGELSPHAAAIEAGFRVRTATVPLTVEGVYRAVLKLSPADQDEVLRLLAERAHA